MPPHPTPSASQPLEKKKQRLLLRSTPDSSSTPPLPSRLAASHLPQDAALGYDAARPARIGDLRRQCPLPFLPDGCGGHDSSVTDPWPWRLLVAALPTHGHGGPWQPARSIDGYIGPWRCMASSPRVTKGRPGHAHPWTSHIVNPR